MTIPKAQTYKPKKRKRKVKHGFFARSSSRYGRRVLTRRRRKGRYKLSV
ncbi:MAG: 50S ribosomal protein L34 [Candidatus Yanofskybacteria bacterium RIFCSPHIGHO2_02_FULL_41_29]|uniref:Large ribosomal subunit protein bL34 n=1 Tax=Candidatus Yanofskybacteria bacterium RIFCSPHIGHO2_01_FULL_41_53 TaxID=1802663 RepID=A0A1F8EFL4_9BACT|nr:MAG: 50S ribosomal protein L34 [Candidatus Yanofskybacteria bacterium RIFCSPHIGHO2_01_FULL_41_53]OGN10900.1 MAG: 50S ribosomal protein L34 [Candidatus Yanofskybacteria bacterium RIFCSPHIGHO2_02_FULL_41_29]OGN19321.1 MAG: 50S ribosomal protein L34 [Candidatus Yanofskybacteria bacterium RIFCSPHIGHO2_12_FULL_41_9]OGN21749.1 MAG: 50S ribosomal protein L34 [Candidatus Yanofskybacteria bacterium RIFCSPLOWO2_01_FULL_41_67]OGN29569.1 MAG: 50S ribosomal protein L34 [Candidatus Yanofskybacteria bacter